MAIYRVTIQGFDDPEGSFQIEATSFDDAATQVDNLLQERDLVVIENTTDETYVVVHTGDDDPTPNYGVVPADDDHTSVIHLEDDRLRIVSE